jgi:hypothetical protein
LSQKKLKKIKAMSNKIMPPSHPEPLVPHTLHHRQAAQRVGLQDEIFFWGLIIAEHGFAKGLVHKDYGSGKGFYRWDPYFWRVVAQAKGEMYK